MIRAILLKLRSSALILLAGNSSVAINCEHAGMKLRGKMPVAYQCVFSKEARSLFHVCLFPHSEHVNVFRLKSFDLNDDSSMLKPVGTCCLLYTSDAADDLLCVD